MSSLRQLSLSIYTYFNARFGDRKTKTAIELSAERRRNRLVRKKQQKERQQHGLDGNTSLKSSTFLTQNEIEINRRRLPKRDLSAKYFGEYLTNEMYKLKI